MGIGDWGLGIGDWGLGIGEPPFYKVLKDTFGKTCINIIRDGLQEMIKNSILYCDFLTFIDKISSKEKNISLINSDKSSQNGNNNNINNILNPLRKNSKSPNKYNKIIKYHYYKKKLKI